MKMKVNNKSWEVSYKFQPKSQEFMVVHGLPCGRQKVGQILNYSYLCLDVIRRLSLPLDQIPSWYNRDTHGWWCHKVWTIGRVGLN